MSTPIANFPLTESRIATLVRAQTLAEAQHMGLIESIFDFFRGGIKRAAVTGIYEKIAAADRAVDGSSAMKQLARFRALQDMIRPEHLDTLQVETTCDLASQTWEYEFKVAGTCIASGYRLPYGTGHDFAAFRDAEVLGRVQCLMTRKNFDMDAVFDGPDGVRERFGQINALNGHIAAPDADIATKFGAMAEDLMQVQQRFPEKQACKFEIDIYERILYRLKVDGHVVHSALLPSEENDRHNMFVALASAAISLDAAKLLHDRNTRLMDRDHFVACNVECMAESKENQLELERVLDDQHFCSRNYTGLATSESRNTFIAEFGDRKLILSNRPPTMGELRADSLKNLLANNDYSSLHELVAGFHLGPRDNILSYAVNGVISQYLTYMSPHEIDLLCESIAGIEIGNTTFGALDAATPHSARRRSTGSERTATVQPAGRLPQFA